MELAGCYTDLAKGQCPRDIVKVTEKYLNIGICI